ncbi:3-methyl-2-oxobutanoate hydroxymethyltransferase [Clostridium frigidicarnis]|uniref:3-methyl-2-oxobutanoate hydroxymethyltransferase n=1 Tax=Clostridium frigidicarnis TaxID=84698 RepID=A0A1I0ZF63_9CLOT|nr:3-methyl-2-oxobutanoate hydroxymethyltransferase [Clostridium frigidicarnis]SFB22833.1 ketopantoate hydroxymethyltransferase [Clostridium frigidicarnis]
MKNTVETFKLSKNTSQRLTMLTAYDFSTAKLIDECGINGILVGDSLGMVALGYENTLSVTMNDMLHHTKAVKRGVSNSLLVADMPFMSYQTSTYDAIKNAGRLIQKGGADAIKLEGGSIVKDKVKAIVNSQIPVMGHIGLTPQSINVFGGFKVQGKTTECAEQLIKDALSLEEAGAFAIVLECIPSKLAKIITEKLSIPTIGIGAGNSCDGQILVYQDMLNMVSNFKPKFVKTYSNVGDIMKSSFKQYINEVNAQIFPNDSNSFSIDEEALTKLY